jgi:hypothetical protein
MKKFKPHKVDWPQIERFLASADKKLALAQKILAFDEEACLQQAYEAMLKASLGFMFSCGFRAKSQPHRQEACWPSDRLRRKRNMALYDDTGFVSHRDADQALEAARDYLAVVHADINDRKP